VSECGSEGARGSLVFKGDGGVTLLATARSKRMVGDGSTFNEKILDEINGVDSPKIPG
jgi:hypothetical protein